MKDAQLLLFINSFSKLFIKILFMAIIISANTEGTYYNIDNGICPGFEPGGYEIAKSMNNSFIQFGYTIGSQNQIKLKLDTDASVSFKWRHDNLNGSGNFVFLAPNLENPIECPSKGANSRWDEFGPVDIKGGEIKWLLTRLNDVGYLDDILIKYKGCNVSKFNIYPEDCELDNEKILYIEFSNLHSVNNARLDLIMPQGIKIKDYSFSGFFCGARIERNEEITSIIQPNSKGMNSAEIKLWLAEIPHGRHSIEIINLKINDKYQHPSLFNCKWSINSNNACVSVERENINYA